MPSSIEWNPGSIPPGIFLRTKGQPKAKDIKNNEATHTPHVLIASFLTVLSFTPNLFKGYPLPSLILYSPNLSVFVDESCDFGINKKSSPYYIITMIFHDQSFNIQEQIDKLEYELSRLGYEKHVVHTEPLIMRRGEYGYLAPSERRAIFQKIYHFTVRSNIRYKQFYFDKKEFINTFELRARIAVAKA